jgi:hypothetical protein
VTALVRKDEARSPQRHRPTTPIARSDIPASNRAELDQAISIAHAFFLGEEPWRRSDCDIVSTAGAIAETSGLGADDIKGLLFAERDAKNSLA